LPPFIAATLTSMYGNPHSTSSSFISTLIEGPVPTSIFRLFGRRTATSVSERESCNAETVEWSCVASTITTSSVGLSKYKSSAADLFQPRHLLMRLAYDFAAAPRALAGIMRMTLDPT